MKTIAGLFSLTCTWGGFEMYHQMRMQELLSLQSMVYALASVALVFLGGLIARTVMGAK